MLKRGRGQPPKYPWRQLQIGESFFVENPPKKFPQMVWTRAQEMGVWLKQRKENNGRRVWRLA